MLLATRHVVPLQRRLSALSRREVHSVPEYGRKRVIMRLRQDE